MSPLIPMQRRWEPRDLPHINDAENRSPEALAAVIDSAEVETHPRYQPVGGQTWCNIFLWDVTRALGCEIPHWVGKAPHRRELSANGICLWLRTSQREWRRAGAAEALAHAARGGPAVACWENPDGHGHVAVLRPCATEIRIAQAGRVCFADGPLVRGFGSRRPEFWIHD
jgi:hypothetical protein